MARDAITDELGSRIGEWIVRTALSGSGDVSLLAGVCEQLNAAGLSIVRGAVGGDLLDPTYDGAGAFWHRGRGVTYEDFTRTPGTKFSSEWLQSPFHRLIESGERTLRRRLDSTYRRGEFPLLDTFFDNGATDYVAFVQRIDESLRFGEFQGMALSWITDARDGFSDSVIDMLGAMVPTLTLAATLRRTHRIARTMITTYLGHDAALRVLGGNIIRGRADPIRAVIWFSDLVSFTSISDRVGAEGMLALLNDYAEAQVEAIEANGGHVLKFIGDGLLAIFPDAEGKPACTPALDAAVEQRRRIAALNERRTASELPVTDAHIALHVGELLYGNVGSPRRLDFTVLGPAVNETARIEALCRSLEQSVIVSSAFADAAGDARIRLVSLGRYAMKGVARPQELFTLDPEALVPRSALAAGEGLIPRGAPT
jgi:adenylate cyclase